MHNALSSKGVCRKPHELGIGMFVTYPVDRENPFSALRKQRIQASRNNPCIAIPAQFAERGFGFSRAIRGLNRLASRSTSSLRVADFIIRGVEDHIWGSTQKAPFPDASNLSAERVNKLHLVYGQ